MAERALPVVAERTIRAASPSVAFPELVQAHYRWRRARPDDVAADDRYRLALERFEQQEGRIVNAYWCTNVESGVALTEKPRPKVLRRALGPQLTFHRVSDWATKGEPAVAVELHRCDELAVRAAHVLTGLRRRICMQLVIAAAAHLLSLVDARAAHEDDAKTQQALEQERECRAEAERYYCEAANGQAQMLYVAGMVASAAVLAGGIGAALWVTFGNRNLFGALIAGSIGAVISVVQRINSGTFNVEYDVGRPYVLFLGALRPAIGAVFAVVVSAAVTSNMVRLPGVSDTGDQHFAALMVVAFFAGFSERWAQDTIASSVPMVSKAVSRPGPKPTA